MKMQDKAAAGTFILTVVAAIIAISQLPATANAFFEPFASKLIAKKMMLKHAFVPLPAVSKPMFYVVHQPTPPPPPPPSPTYPPYGPQPPSPTYPPYGPQPPSYPSYQPPSSYQVVYRPPSPPSYHVSYSPPSAPSYSGYEPAPVVKPLPPSGCSPAGTTSTSPAPTVDYSHYSVQSSLNYGNNGNNGGYGKK